MNSRMGKILGSLFAAIVAPILVGVAVNYSQKFMDDGKGDAAKDDGKSAASKTGDAKGGDSKAEVAKAEPGKNDSSKPKSGAGEGARAEVAKNEPTNKEPSAKPEANASSKPADAPVNQLAEASTKAFPKKFAKRGLAPIHLFNGKDLTNFYTYLGRGEHSSPLGKDNDPEHVFTVVQHPKDGAMIRISGRTFGGLVTEKEYENYHLTFEYKWGPKKWPPRESMFRLGGVIVHCQGSDAAVKGNWPEGFRCQIDDIGGTGNVQLSETPSSRLSLTAHALRHDPLPNVKNGRVQYSFLPRGPEATLDSGTMFRMGREPLHPRAKAAPPPDLPPWERPPGEWNSMEIICPGEALRVFVNGKMVNGAAKVSQTKGRIFFVSEAAEIFFRNIELKPLPKDMSVARRGP